jgi:hypothetical protein
MDQALLIVEEQVEQVVELPTDLLDHVGVGVGVGVGTID